MSGTLTPPVRFGLVINGDEPDGHDSRAVLREQVAEAVAARDAGFDAVSAVHRYSYGPANEDERGTPLTTWRMQPLLLLAHLAAHLGDTLNYGTGILLSTSAHPVQLAEDVATLDAMCHGRLRLGIGLGWMPYELDAFGVDRSTRGKRFTELLSAYRALLTEDEVSFAGEHFTFDRARLVARPVQRPGPPVWVGASSPAAVRRAAQLGDALIMSAHMDMPTLLDQRQLFCRLRAEAGLAQPTQVPISRLVVIAKDRETALREVRPTAEEWYRKRGEWGWFVTNGKDADVALLGDGRWIVGDPDDCIQQVARLRDELGVTDVLCTMPPHVGHQRRMETVSLLGRHVIPEFSSAGAPTISGRAG
jgi:alkanesulfonate monooxygenase SsuD/methylene tetrahydromethanopterin reductase-like flavin-dependent oxidoreductase (luciferase family)